LARCRIDRTSTRREHRRHGEHPRVAASVRNTKASSRHSQRSRRHIPASAAVHVTCSCLVRPCVRNSQASNPACCARTAVSACRRSIAVCPMSRGRASVRRGARHACGVGLTRGKRVAFGPDVMQACRRFRRGQLSTQIVWPIHVAVLTPAASNRERLFRDHRRTHTPGQFLSPASVGNGNAHDLHLLNLRQAIKRTSRDPAAVRLPRTSFRTTDAAGKGGPSRRNTALSGMFNH